MRLLRYRLIRYVRDEPRKAPKSCPRCGRRMMTRTIYYECPGCGYTEHLPTAMPHRDIQPVDNLAHKLEESQHADDPAEREFALATVPPEMEREYRWLFGACIAIFGFITFAWAIPIWLDQIGSDGESFRLCWGLTAVGGLILCVALMHPARLMKQLGIAVACLLIPLQVAIPYLIPPEAQTALLGKWPDAEDYAAVFIATRAFFLAVAYCIWAAWYLIRERRLQGW